MRIETSLRTILLAALAAAALFTGGFATQRAIDTGFGPPNVSNFERDDAPSAGVARIPPPYAAARETSTKSALAVRRTRIDIGDPNEQNWEVALQVAHADAQSADRDEVYAAWMTGRGGPDETTVTGLRFARSIDGARSFAPVDVQVPASARFIPFDPSVATDALDGKSYIGAAGQDSDNSRALWVAPSLGNDTSAFAPGALLPAGRDAVDKLWLAAGPAPNDTAARVLYAIDRTGARASTDRGMTWSPAVKPGSLSNLPQPLVFPDGTLALSYYSGSQALFARSTDLARSFSAPAPIHTFVGDYSELVFGALPGEFRTPPVAVFARDPNDGRLYAVLTDVTRRDGTEADLDVLLFESHDNGATWSSGVNITASAPAYSDQFAPFIAIDAQGRLHVAWFDTRRSTGGDAAPNAPVDVWYAMSADHGATWTSMRLTDTPIASERTRWVPIGNNPGGQFIGDYFTIATSARAAYVAHPVLENNVVGMAVSRIDLESSATSTIRDLRGLTGAWYEPATSGQGVELQWLAGDHLLVFFYGHHDNGQNFFLVGTRDGRFGYGESIDVPLVITSGGRYNQLDPNAIQRTAWGTLHLTFASCAAASARLEGPDGVQNLNLQRLALAPDLPCD